MVWSGIIRLKGSELHYSLRILGGSSPLHLLAGGSWGSDDWQRTVLPSSTTWGVRMALPAGDSSPLRFWMGLYLLSYFWMGGLWELRKSLAAGAFIQLHHIGCEVSFVSLRTSLNLKFLAFQVWWRQLPLKQSFRFVVTIL